MKRILNSSILAIFVLSIVSLLIMTLIDYVMGTKASYLNAWSIWNKLINPSSDIFECNTLRALGVYGAASTMIIVNGIFGIVLFFFPKMVRHVLPSLA